LLTTAFLLVPPASDPPTNGSTSNEPAGAASGDERAAFRPLLIGALYPGITRGLSADLLAAQALEGRAYPICTTHVVAGRGIVTDVLTVPTDTVSAQLEHVFSTEAPNAARLGIVGDAATVEQVFRHLEENLEGPFVLDLTLSGPSGEDLIGQRGLEALNERLDHPDLVTARVADASLMAGMEIPSLDDAQVAAQRLVQQGANRVLLRCGRLPTHHFDTESDPPPYAVDLYYDGDDFALFEAPVLEGIEELHGASSGLLVPLLDRLVRGDDLEPGLQKAKARVTEALHAAHDRPPTIQEPTFFDALRHQPDVVETEGEDQASGQIGGPDDPPNAGVEGLEPDDLGPLQ
jgi:hydroxymethylpyrimidine kinase/phosphomethylpyrimidine kinase